MFGSVYRVPCCASQDIDAYSVRGPVTPHFRNDIIDLQFGQGSKFEPIADFPMKANYNSNYTCTGLVKNNFLVLRKALVIETNRLQPYLRSSNAFTLSS